MLQNPYTVGKTIQTLPMPFWIKRLNNGVKKKIQLSVWEALASRKLVILSASPRLVTVLAVLNNTIALSLSPHSTVQRPYSLFQTVPLPSTKSSLRVCHVFSLKMHVLHLHYHHYTHTQKKTKMLLHSYNSHVQRHILHSYYWCLEWEHSFQYPYIF